MLLHGGALEEIGSIARQIKVRNVQAKECDEATNHEEAVRDISDGRRIVQGSVTSLAPRCCPCRRAGALDLRGRSSSRGRRWQAHSDVCETEGEQGEEGDDAHGPAEAHGGVEPAEDDRVDDAPDAAPAGREAVGQGQQARVEPQAGHADGQDGEAARPHPDADALGEQQLPQVRGGALGRGATDDKQAAEGQEVLEVAHVEEWTRHEAQEDHEEGLQGADGGYLKGRVGREQVGGVVRLERAERG